LRSSSCPSVLNRRESWSQQGCSSVAYSKSPTHSGKLSKATRHPQVAAEPTKICYVHREKILLPFWNGQPKLVLLFQGIAQTTPKQTKCPCLLVCVRSDAVCLVCRRADTDNRQRTIEVKFWLCLQTVCASARKSEHSSAIGISDHRGKTPFATKYDHVETSVEMSASSSQHAQTAAPAQKSANHDSSDEKSPAPANEPKRCKMGAKEKRLKDMSEDQLAARSLSFESSYRPRGSER